MKTEILNLLQCPRCAAKLNVTPLDLDKNEIRSGVITCTGPKEHLFNVQDGIIHFAAGFDHDAVKREIEYENSTYTGSDRLTDSKLIAHFPDTLAELWPHTCNFGPDFRVLIDHLKLKSGSWVLDVGTGPCWSSRLLAQQGLKVIAIDVNEANFYGLKTSDILFETHDVYFERILESMTHLPFRDLTLDAITFNASFHHTPDMEKTLSECFRVLKPGGRIAMVNEEFVSLRQRLFTQESVTDTGSHHAIEYSDFEKAVEDAGFGVEYFVAHHVQEKLKKKLSGGLGDLVVKTMEKFPISLKQLNSALIVLTKPRTHNRVAAKEASLAAQT